MEVKLKTKELQSMVTEAIECVSNNKLIPLTSLMDVKVKDNRLTLTTTDATNYFYIMRDKVMCEDFEVSVFADLFTKLIQKTTSEDVSLVIENGAMTVKGNGSYTMELPLDENGQVIHFPKKLNEPINLPQIATLKRSTVKNILAVNRNSLAQTVEVPSLTEYYCGEEVITSDRYKVCSTAIKMFEEPKLISSTQMDLLGVVSDENITVSDGGSYLLFETEHEMLYAPNEASADTFPIDAIKSLLSTEFDSKCTVNKGAVLNVLDRLSLFVSPYDKKGIYLTFTRNGLMLGNKKSSGSELVAYSASENFKDFVALIDIEMLKSQVNTIAGDDLVIKYGNDIAIEIVENNITEIIALAEDTEE